MNNSLYVLIIGKNKQCAKLQEIFHNAGFDSKIFETTMDLEIAELNSAPAALIFKGSPTDVDSRRVKMFLTQFPYLPVLQLSPKRSLRLLESSLIFRRLFQGNTTESLLRNFYEVSSIAKALKERDRYSRLGQLAFRLDEHLDSLDFKLVIAQFFEILEHDSGASNLVWISMRNNTDNIIPVNANKIFEHIERKPLSSRPTSVEEMEQLEKWVLEHYKEWTPYKKRQLAENISGRTVWAIWLPRSQSVMLFIDTLNNQDDPVLSLMPFVDAVLVRALQFTEMKQLTYIDDLTDLYNQRYLQHVLEREVKRSERNNLPFSVLFIDADGLKQINDAHGHLVGSRLITEIGKFVRLCSRTTDYAFRYGGDEFVVILPETKYESAQAVAERLRETVQNNLFQVDGLEIQLTLSIGLAEFPRHAQSAQDVIAMADKAMYDAKRAKKNSVYIAS